MAAIIATDFETALGIAGAATPYSGADDKPLFERDQVVYDLNDLPTTGSNADVTRVAYQVKDIVMIPETSGGVTKLLDQSLAFATSAVSDSGTTTRSVSGWQHTTVPAATVAATTPSGPWFYTVQRVSDGTMFYNIHQTRLTNQASVETYIAAEIANWWV
jgi:hypothetical protein